MMVWTSQWIVIPPNKRDLLFTSSLLDKNGDLQPLCKYIQVIIEWLVRHSEIFILEPQETTWPYNMVYLYEVF